jgi:hypothetical protein
VTIASLAAGPAEPLRLGAGAFVRVDDASQTRTWCARVAYVSGEIFGLRGSTDADQIFATRDVVTLHIGRDDVTLESQARVLAATARTLRVLATRGVGALERRRAVRLQASQQLTVRALPCGDERSSVAIDAELLDLSLTGCALRSGRPLPVGSRIAVATPEGSSTVPLVFLGEVVRGWCTGASEWFFAGVQFDPMPACTRDAVQRYFTEHIRRTSTAARRTSGTGTERLLLPSRHG